MYKLNKSATEFDIMQAIDGNDIYNSKFIYDLDLSPIAGNVQPTLYKGRLDLIADDLYESTDPIYYEVLAILNRSFQEDNTTYDDLRFISKTQLRTLKLG